VIGFFVEKDESFTFFYRKESPFSQFHPSAFTGESLFPQRTYEDNPLEVEISQTHSHKSTVHKFHCCEQWMMFNKAELFKDYKSAQAILKASTPMQCKQLGRKVRNFVEEEWKKHNRRIIYEGNFLKFSQNPSLLEALKETEGTSLVEASPTDRIYGIGLAASDPRAKSRNTWKGRNLLGEVLTELRDNIC